MRRVFLGSDRPLAELVAEALLRDAPRLGRAADLSGLAVLAPTRRAARRIREALARLARAEGLGGVITPELLTPDAFIRACAAPASIAPPDVAERILARALAALDPSSLAELLPHPPSPWTPARLLPVARAILLARHALGDGATAPDFRTLAAIPDLPEPERRQTLARIEETFLELSAKLGYADAGHVRAEAVRHPRPPPGVRRIALASVPDASPALRGLIRNTGLPVLVLIDDAADHADRFDEFGAPLPDRAPPIPWGDFENFVRTVRLPETPAELTRSLSEVFSARPPDGRSVACILADPALARPVARALENAGATPNHADGEPLDRHPRAVILRDWSRFLRERSWDAAMRLLRRPDFARLLDDASTHAEILADADRAAELLLPHDAAPLREFPEEPAPLTRTRARLVALDRISREFSRNTFPRALDALLRDLGPAGTDGDAMFAETAATHARAVGQAVVKLGEDDPAEALDMLLSRLADTALHPELGAECPALRGWLELPWEEAPHLVIAGLNEGRVPESVAADAFLPGSLRRRIGLPADEDRAARDAHLLARALARRAGGAGRVDAYAPRHDTAGEPLRPSRLLTHGAGADLAARVLRLHAEPQPAAPEPAPIRAWRWVPRVDPEALRRADAGIAPTAFKDYLECPLRFYLKRVAGARAGDPDRAEPDAAAFGDLVHGALAAFALDPVAAALADEDAVRAALLDFLADESRRRHGAAPSLAALVQGNAARARLSGFARAQAELRREGWRIALAEAPFAVTLLPDGPDGAPFVVRGRFDRIDRHEDGRVRVVDYKTADAGTPPAAAHLATADKAGAYPDFSYTSDAAGRGVRWTNLQLPLYAEAALTLPELGGAFPELAYAVLPASASDAATALWADYHRDLHRDAMRCAEGVARAIRARRFRPGPRKPLHDDFAELLGDAPEEAADLDAFERELARA